MVLLYQIAIFLIIILSSFVGFKGLIIAVSAIVLFSISNIFTLQLLVIQFTTIVVATIIGAIIATIKLAVDMPKIVNDKVNSIIYYFERNGFPGGKYFTQYLLRCGFRVFTTFCTISIFALFGMDSESLFINIIFFIGFILTIFPLVSVTARDGGFIEDSSTFRFLMAIGCIFIGYKMAYVIWGLWLGLA